jgi:hypothetical protein
MKVERAGTETKNVFMTARDRVADLPLLHHLLVSVPQAWGSARLPRNWQKVIGKFV